MITEIMTAFFYRVRGGLIDDIIGRELQNFAIRSAWALWIAYIFADSWQIIPLLYAAALCGVTPGYFNGQFNLAIDENNITKNWRQLTLRGMFIMFPVALVMLPFNNPAPWYGVVAGALFVPCYLLGFQIYKKLPFQAGSQWGEWLLGLAIGIGIQL